jgi:hypothetical protein
VAVNYACTLCETLALAYQIIFGIGEPVAFTEEGLARLAEIKGELEELGDSGLSLEEIQASVDELVEEIHYILETELAPLEEASSDGPDTEPETETTRTTETATTESTTTGTTTTTETTTETTTAETTEAP